MTNLCGIQSVAFTTSPQSPPQNLPHKGGRSAVRDVRRPHHNQQSCRLPPPVGRDRGGGKAKAQHQTQHRAAPDLGMAQQRWSEALYPSTPPEEVLLATHQTRPPGGRSGAARRRIRALIPGEEGKRSIRRVRKAQSGGCGERPATVCYGQGAEKCIADGVTWLIFGCQRACRGCGWKANFTFWLRDFKPCALIKK